MNLPDITHTLKGDRMKESDRAQKNVKPLKNFLKKLAFNWQHNLDLHEYALFVCVCIMVVFLNFIGVFLFVRNEYIASGIFILTVFLCIKDFLWKTIEDNRKERKALERSIDSQFRTLYSKAYVTSTCKDCTFRFSCYRAYKKEETYGKCSLDMYKK